MRYIFTSLFLTSLMTLNAAEKPLPKRICANHQIEHYHLIENFSSDQLRSFSMNARKADDDASYTVPVINNDTVYTIQVVVHVVYTNDNKYENPSDELIQSQIDALNRDFNLENDINHIREEFFPFIGNAKIRFELAKVNPNGQPTTGITRKKSSPILLPDWNPVFENIKNSGSGGVNPWKPKEYLNIWVCDLNISSRVSKNSVELDWEKGALGGYAQPPLGLPNWVTKIGGVETSLAMTPELKQGVVIDFRFFGQNSDYNKDYFNSSPHYGMGRTTVHEIGHYLGLRHVWGDGAAQQLLNPNVDLCLDVDDGIKDTPSSATQYSEHIESGNVCGVDVNTCNLPYPGDGIDYPDMRENYMDYSTDVCYGMFTKEQVNMMRYALTEKRGGIIAKREVAVPTAIYTQKSFEASVHPNPANDVLNVRFNEISFVDTKISIINTLGQTVTADRISKGSRDGILSVKDLAPGMYIIQMTQGEKSFTQRFIKK